MISENFDFSSEEDYEERPIGKSANDFINPATVMVLHSDPSQISIKQISQMFTSDEAKKMTAAITAANKDMVLQTKDFEKEVHLLENAKAKAEKERHEKNKLVRQEKRKVRNQNRQDFLNVIATPESNSRKAESIKSFRTQRSIVSKQRVLSPDIFLPKLKKRTSTLKLPTIPSSTRHNKNEKFNTVENQTVVKRHSSVRPRSQFIGTGGALQKEKNSTKPAIFMQNQVDGGEAGDIKQSSFQKQGLVSFGRRVIPVQDRAAERKLIIEKRKHMDMLIAGGLKSAGIEMDAEEKRIQALLNSTQSSMAQSDLQVNQNVFLPPLIEKQGSVTIPLTEEGESSSEFNVFGTSGGPLRSSDSKSPFDDPKRKTVPYISGASPKRIQRKKTKLGPLLNANQVTIDQMQAHRIELQILRNRTLRLAQEEEEKKNGGNGDKAAKKNNIFNMTMRASGTFYSVQSTATGAITQWQMDGKFDAKEPLSYHIQKELLTDYTFGDEELQEFIDDPRLLALAQIKFMNQEDKEVSENSKESEIKEMVGYLLNQKDQSAQVEVVTTRLLKKVYTQEYNQFTQDAYQLVSDYAFEVRDKKLFIDICKNSTKPRLEYNIKMNYLLKYHNECNKQGIVPLPILFKVRNKRLNLKGYGLNQGLCKSFATSLAIYPELLDGINFQNNGMSDSDLAITFEGLTKLTTLKVIIIKNNIFMEKACAAIGEILKRTVPNNLEEFRLIEVRTNPFIMSKLCSTLSQVCHLRKLSLASAELSDQNVTGLCSLVKNARFLIDFDISSNKISPGKMCELSRVLAENRSLQVINLSWNFFTHQFTMKDYIAGISDIDAQNGDGHFYSDKDKLIMQNRDISKDRTQRDKDKDKDPNNTSMQESRLREGRMSMTSVMSRASTPPQRSNSNTPLQTAGGASGVPAQWHQSSTFSAANLTVPGIHEPTYADYKRRVYANYEFLLDQENSSVPQLARQQIETVANVCQMIKRNKSLLHIDLSHTHLTEYMLWHIGKALSRARSVISVHLSGNQGITPTLKEQLLTRIRCKPQNEHFKVSFENGLDASNKMMRTQQGRFKKHDEMVVQERMKVRQIMKQQIDGGSLSGNLVKDQSKLIFERKLGHKTDIPGSGQWNMIHRHHEGCWVCSHKIYTMFFWMPTFGWQDDSVDPVLEENLVNQIEDINEAFFEEPITEPAIFCGSTEWRPKKLRKLEDFFFEVDQSKPNFLEQMKNKKMCRQERESIADFTESEREKYDELVRRHKMSSYTSSDDIKKIILRDLRFKKMQFFNTELLEMLDKGETDGEQNQIYVFADFFSSGRQALAICMQDEEDDLQFFTHKLVILKRQEEVPNFVKYIRTTALVRTFNKSNSVFADWKEDRADTALSCIEHDLELVHTDKFIKDENERAETHDVIKKYAKEIKNIFIQLASRSSFPQIGWIDFSTFSNKTELPDAKGAGTFVASQIDTQFIAANNGTISVQYMDPSILMRYKFVELIARIAQAKYVNQQKEVSTAGAVERLMTDVILKNYQWEPWQEYRQEVCYKLEVNDILAANFEGIKGLIEHYYAPRKLYMNKKDCLSLFMKDSNVLLGEKETTYAYGMSKMTVEKESKTPRLYEKIEVPEMCEMICRVADMKFKTSTTMSMEQKIEIVLEELFVVTGYSRKEVNVVQEEQSESDDEY